MPDIIIGLILGMVEGLTEYAPVSSTGHMILVGHLLGFQGTHASTFEVVIQLGSSLAGVVIFRKRILNIVGLYKLSGEEIDEQKERLNALHILCGMIPTVIVGGLFHDYIKALFTPQKVLIGLIGGDYDLGGGVRARPKTTSLDQITYWQAFTVGLFQCLALWPGFSRSGSTISGGLLVGMNHKTASEYTFILAVPMMVAASAKDLYDNWNMLSVHDLLLFISGFVTAFVVAMLAIKYFLKLIDEVRLTPFALYRFAVTVVYGLLVL